jgi:hypothetical protein
MKCGNQVGVGKDQCIDRQKISSDKQEDITKISGMKGKKNSRCKIYLEESYVAKWIKRMTSRIEQEYCRNKH